MFACLGYYHFIVFVAWNFLLTKTNRDKIKKVDYTSFLSLISVRNETGRENPSIDKVRLNYSPIIHRRYRLLHPGPGVQRLRLEGRAVHVTEHRHPDQTLETLGIEGRCRHVKLALMWRDMLSDDD